jgi:hypothetical protein
VSRRAEAAGAGCPAVDVIVDPGDKFWIGDIGNDTKLSTA